ncbi:hypothetical protein KT99_06914 [Shewanella benthica KT99]|uniref:Uncharacterized protein n=1 Tax=Shewanella benthica KT99 TaxID=314608 RepID=A9D881_9GAMM|nr:hypothetical protein KT99_06914 [Shewanella benthica KT99]
MLFAATWGLMRLFLMTEQRETQPYHARHHSHDGGIGPQSHSTPARPACFELWPAPPQKDPVQ